MESTAYEPPASEFPEGDYGDLTVDLPARGVAPEEVVMADAPTESAFDPETSEVVERDEFSTTYVNEDGTHTTRVGYVAANVEVDGEWVPIETEITEDGTEGWSVEEHPLEPTFSEEADDEGVFEVSSAGETLSFTLEGADPDSEGEPGVGGNDSEIGYDDVVGDVDLRYEVDRSQVKETLVLDSVPAAGENRWVWSIEAGALVAAKNEIGDIEFRDTDGTVVFVIPAPVMWDSSAVEGVRESELASVDTELSQGPGGEWVLALEADAEWLSDPARVYPVFVDPTAIAGEAHIQAYKQNSSTVLSYVNVGNPMDAGQNKWRSAVHYNYEGLFGRQVLAVGLRRITTEPGRPPVTAAGSGMCRR